MLRCSSVFSFLPQTASLSRVRSPFSLFSPLEYIVKLHCSCSSVGTTTSHRTDTIGSTRTILPAPTRSEYLFSTMQNQENIEGTVPEVSKRAPRKADRGFREKTLRYKLEKCSKEGNLLEALRLYDEALRNGVPLSVYLCNILLYLCSAVKDRDQDLSKVNYGLKRGFAIFEQMRINNIVPNEATFTNLARLAALKEDPDLAFSVIKSMTSHRILPRLRSYGPALFEFCKQANAEGAFAVEAQMVASGVSLEEPELAALIQVSSAVADGEKVYYFLHQLRIKVRQVCESTAVILEKWFHSRAAAEVGKECLESGKVNEEVAKGGAGWHGLGWLGKGEWNAVRSHVDEGGVCGTCGERLASIDIDPEEAENFACSLEKLVRQREVDSHFTRFQKWIACNGPFEAVIDGANVGRNNRKGFHLSVIASVIKEISQLNPSKKLPLVILHSHRVKGGGSARMSGDRKLIESWRKAGILYATPYGSNDDWYWLYAAVSNKCLVVTNDEMRDHLFDLLGTSFFPRWKEKHQVRVKFAWPRPILHLPPPYSIVIQESENGRWHIPTTIGDDIETPKQWICATRANMRTLVRV